MKGIGRGDHFFKVARRNIGYVIQHLGDRPLDAYSSSDAASFRDWLFQRNLTSTSIQRIFSTIRAAMMGLVENLRKQCAGRSIIGLEMIFLQDRKLLSFKFQMIAHLSR